MINQAVTGTEMPAPFGAPFPVIMRSPPRSSLARLLAHVREFLQFWSPMYLRTRTGLLIRIRRRTELRIYERMFVEDMFPLSAITIPVEVAPPMVFDVGACFGYFALSVLDRHPTAQVHLFEANPQLISTLEHHRDINHLAGWTINHGAVGASAEPVEIYLTSSPLVASVNAAKADLHRKKRSIVVPGIRLDDYVREKSVPRIAVMKLDVEGCEEQVIKASPVTMARVEALFIRVFPPFSELARVTELLSPYGLRLVEGARHHHDEHLFVRPSPTQAGAAAQRG